MNKIEWSGVTTAYEHKCNPTAELRESTPAGLRKVWLLDAQWSTCPIEVEEQVRLLWRWYENGNDKYVIKTTLGDLKDFHQNEDYVDENGKLISTDAIVQYAEETGLVDEDAILIHWWW